jgi:hypothetical protein
MGKSARAGMEQDLGLRQHQMDMDEKSGALSSAFLFSVATRRWCSIFATEYK